MLREREREREREKEREEKKSRWDIRKNAMSYIKEIVEATPHETTDVRPLTSHL